MMSDESNQSRCFTFITHHPAFIIPAVGSSGVIDQVRAEAGSVASAPPHQNFT
jgi:hypothetical protein